MGSVCPQSVARIQHWYTTLRNVAHEHFSWTVSCYTAGKSGSTHPRKCGGTYSGHAFPHEKTSRQAGGSKTRNAFPCLPGKGRSAFRQYLGRMTDTEQWAFFTTSVATDPANSCRNPIRPCAPTTMQSMSLLWAYLTTSSELLPKRNAQSSTPSGKFVFRKCSIFSSRAWVGAILLGWPSPER